MGVHDASDVNTTGPGSAGLFLLGQEIHARAGALRLRARHPGTRRESLRGEYDEIRGMCLGYYIASRAWKGPGDPREGVADYTRDALGLDLPALAVTVEVT